MNKTCKPFTLEVNRIAHTHTHTFQLFGVYEAAMTLIRDFVKALEATTPMKQRKISCTLCRNCAVSNLSLHGSCILRSLQDSAKVVISRLLACSRCSLAVVASPILPVNDGARWRSRHGTVVATSGPRWVELGHAKVAVSWLLYFHVLFRSAPTYTYTCTFQFF